MRKFLEENSKFSIRKLIITTFITSTFWKINSDYFFLYVKIIIYASHMQLIKIKILQSTMDIWLIYSSIQINDLMFLAPSLLLGIQLFWVEHKFRTWQFNNGRSSSWRSTTQIARRQNCQSQVFITIVKWRVKTVSCFVNKTSGISPFFWRSSELNKVQNR